MSEPTLYVGAEVHWHQGLTLVSGTLLGQRTSKPLRFTPLGELFHSHSGSSESQKELEHP